MKIKNILLGTLLGDSYLGKIKPGTRYAPFRVDHCPEQKDYLDFIADEIRKEFNQHVSVYYREKRKIFCLYYNNPIFKEWRETYYPNDKKDIIRILNDIDDPLIALSYWLMDDGCIHYSTKNKNLLSPRLLIATCSETLETQNLIIDWFTKNVGITPYITTQRNHKRNKEWFLLKFTVEDSYKLWLKIRHNIIQLPSMKHKFRILEQEFKKPEYRIKYLQERPTTK